MLLHRRRDKPYDGNTDATVASRSLIGVVPGDVVTLDGGTAQFDTSSVGTGKTVTLLGATLGGVDAASYTLSVTPIDTTAAITAKELTISGAVADNKPYDGSTDATVTFTGASLNGVVPGDVVTIDSAAYNATFDTKNVGTAKPVTVTGVALSGADAGNYTVAQPAGLTADITALELTVAGATADNKVYDGSTDATVTFTFAGLVGAIDPDVVGLVTTGYSASFADKDIGIGKTVTVIGLTLGGADAGNYTLAQPLLSANITPKTVTGAFTAGNKPYDGTTDATVATRSLVGTITGDVVTLSGGTATFDTKNVGTGKTVTLTGATLSGTDAGNYILGSVATTTADITPKTVTGSFASANKPYDGTTDASATARSVAGTLPGDVVTLSGGTAAFADKNVGTGKTVTLTGATLGGADAGNYALSVAPITTTANITALELTGSFASANKPYDGTTDASATARSVAGTLPGDVVTLSGGTAAHSPTRTSARARPSP